LFGTRRGFGQTLAIRRSTSEPVGAHNVTAHFAARRAAGGRALSPQAVFERTASVSKRAGVFVAAGTCTERSASEVVGESNTHIVLPAALVIVVTGSSAKIDLRLVANAIERVAVLVLFADNRFWVDTMIGARQFGRHTLVDSRPQIETHGALWAGYLSAGGAVLQTIGGLIEQPDTQVERSAALSRRQTLIAEFEGWLTDTVQRVADFAIGANGRAAAIDAGQ